MDSTAVEKQFSRAGETYEQATGIQQVVAGELVRRVGFARQILEIGAGTGYATRLLSEKCPAAGITALDISPGMLEVLRRRMMSSKQVDIVCDDFLKMRADKRFDLIVSSSCLQWIASLESAFERMSGMLASGGSMLAAIMTRGTLGELRELRNELFPGLRPRRELPGREEISKALSKTGMRILEMTERVYEDNAPSAWGLFESLRLSGLTGGDLCLGRRPLMRRELVQLAEAYDARHRTEQGLVRASYRVLFVEARK